MKLRLLTIVLLLLAASPVSAQTGAEIIQQQLERHSIASARCTAQMILVDKQDNRVIRTLRLLTREHPEGRDFLAVFIAPEDVQGTGLLARVKKEGPNELFLYLPATDTVQPISEGSKKNYFMGTDFTYEDLQPERPEYFDYEILRSEFLDGQNCWVIKAVTADPGQARKSSYSKRLMWITKGHLATLRVEFFDRRDRLNKVLANEEIMVWRPKIMTMTNSQTGHQTIIKLLGEEEINVPLDASLFTPDALKRRVHCR